MMFGLFRKKTYSPTVTPEDKEWIEQNIIWLIEVFGFDRLLKTPFILPIKDNFPYNNLNNDIQLLNLLNQLCENWGIDISDISVKIFDDIKSKQWTNWMPHGKFKEGSGYYSQELTTEKKLFNIGIAKSNLDNPQHLISVMSHELAHVKLLGGGYIATDSPDMEYLTDLATIFFGFGIFVANSCFTQDVYWISKTGYLPAQLISYTNALICYISEHDPNDYFDYFNSNTKGLFEQDWNFLLNTDNTLLTKNKAKECQHLYELNNNITKGFKDKDFNQVIDNCNKLLDINSKNVAALNNLGYALIQKRDYSSAIEFFTKAIEIEPYWDYPYNNRGYCKLQLGQTEDAFTDLQSSFDMNPENSFSCRNLGAFYLVNNEFRKALSFFEDAEKIDPNTEMINYYLYKTHEKLGNVEIAKKYFEKSNYLNEYNDSILL